MSRYKSIYNITTATQHIPSTGEIMKRETDLHITFNASDRLDLISYRVYNDPQYWWVILAANGFQLEFEIEDGEILRIPYPLADAMVDIKRNIHGRS
jgi:nucleoid-associated protein YgaU